MQRIRAGFVMVRNPRNPEHVMRVSLAADDVIAIVFWSRDYGRLLPYLDEIDARELRPCFQFTLTGYGAPLELRGPSEEQGIDQFRKLSARYGSRRVIWRYDPIVMGSRHDATWHLSRFEELARRLAGVSSDAVISFLDMYASARRGLAAVAEATGERFDAPTLEERIELAGKMVAIGVEHGMRVRICCEPDVAASAVIEPARCIDPELIQEIAGAAVLNLRAAPARKGCGCVFARDIGAYHCCAHGCVYCYANDSPEAGLDNARKVDASANHLGAGDIAEQKPPSRKGAQQLRLALDDRQRGRR